MHYMKRKTILFTYIRIAFQPTSSQIKFISIPLYNIKNNFNKSYYWINNITQSVFCWTATLFLDPGPQHTPREQISHNSNDSSESNSSNELLAAEPENFPN